MQATCPKRMVYGPCGGVRVRRRVRDGGVPVRVRPAQRGHPTGTDRSRGRPCRPPLVLTDLSVPPADAPTLTATAKILAASSDALLVGDHQDRIDFPPSMLARLIADAGGRPWVTLACRDRNRVSLEQELHALRHDGMATVLCVTGDGRAYDVRPDVTQAFDLDGTRLAALAAAARRGGRRRGDSYGAAHGAPTRPAGAQAAGRRADRGAQPCPVGRRRGRVPDRPPAGWA